MIEGGIVKLWTEDYDDKPTAFSFEDVVSFNPNVSVEVTGPFPSDKGTYVKFTAADGIEMNAYSD